MSNLKYLIPRLIRHFMPESMAHFIKKRGWIIKAGLETREPLAASTRYQKELAEAGCSLNGKRILLFGYGGRFAVACALLDAGAGHIVLCEYNLQPDHRFNRNLLNKYGRYLDFNKGKLVPNTTYITLAHGDIRTLAKNRQIESVDVVLSNSVFEHLDDVPGITNALASLTHQDGLHLHFIDLRDHYFKYPFEMLCYSERIWQNWLNPSSNLNRLRLWHYQQIFSENFKEVNISILANDVEKFSIAKPRLQPEYISCDITNDSAMVIKVLAFRPIPI